VSFSFFASDIFGVSKWGSKWLFGQFVFNVVSVNCVKCNCLLMSGPAIYDWTSFIAPARSRCRRRLTCDKLRRSSNSKWYQAWHTAVIDAIFIENREFFTHTHARARARTHTHTHTHMHSTPPLIVIVFSRLDRGIQSATEMLPLILKSGRRCCLHLFQSGNGFQILKRGSRDPIWGNLSFVEVSYDSGPTPCEFS